MEQIDFYVLGNILTNVKFTDEQITPYIVTTKMKKPQKWWPKHILNVILFESLFL